MKIKLLYQIILLACLLFVAGSADAAGLRRPISPAQPAWIIHIDVWNYADPQKIIDMVPKDVRPFVIFNIATSTNNEKSADGPAIYDSWMKVCAQNRVWTMIQCASGAMNRMPDTPGDVSAYEKYFQDYPNFLGFNFAEQYWGFDSDAAFETRLNLFASLLDLCKTYGGFLAVSFADSYYSANKMPVAYMKRNAAINTFLSSSPEHFLCFEKYTQKKNFLDIESHCLGAWLSGFVGQYGIRFDSSGWIGNGDKPDMVDGDTQYTIGSSDFVRAAGAIPVAEHMMLTGQTIMDGPELSWTECSTEGSTTTVDGYTQRNWEWMPQWKAITLDLFRKILDGTIPIMTKDEVMTRTKVCVVSGGSSSNNDSYRTPAALFDGLYRNIKDYGGLQGRDDNHWLNNRWWMKSTGRYPAIPNMLSAGALTDISGNMSSIESKQSYLNTIFPEEYTGDIYAGRQNNGWVTYNPYQYDDVNTGGIRTLSKATKRATGNIPFQYNTCTSVDLDYAPYSLGIMKEYANKVTFYLSNYEGGTDIIKINGASSKPSYTANSGSISESWEDNVYTLTVTHSHAAVELTINCIGGVTGRPAAPNPVSLTLAPTLPDVYTGILQYEAELADYKSATIQKSGYEKGHDGYRGQGFAEMNSSSSSLRYHVCVPKDDYYTLTLRYQSDAAGSMTVATADNENQQMELAASGSTWSETTVSLLLAGGERTIELINTGGQPTYIDCIQLTKQDKNVIMNSVIPAGTSTMTDAVYQRALVAPGEGMPDAVISGKDVKLYTICLPDTPPTGDGIKYYTLSGFSNNSLLFSEVASPAANTPYLVAVTSNTSLSKTGMNVNFDAAINNGSSHNGYQLKGTLRGMNNADAAAAGAYVLQAGNQWGKVTTENTAAYIPPFRAYIVGSSTAGTRLMGSIGDGGATAIHHIQTVDADGTERWYDLSGRPISKPSRKGVYIRNGKKYVINN